MITLDDLLPSNSGKWSFVRILLPVVTLATVTGWRSALKLHSQTHQCQSRFPTLKEILFRIIDYSLPILYWRLHIKKSNITKLMIRATRTLPKTNIAPENRPSQKETNLPTIHFQVLCLLVSGRVKKHIPKSINNLWMITSWGSNLHSKLDGIGCSLGPKVIPWCRFPKGINSPSLRV